MLMLLRDMLLRLLAGKITTKLPAKRLSWLTVTNTLTRTELNKHVLLDMFQIIMVMDVCLVLILTLRVVVPVNIFWMVFAVTVLQVTLLTHSRTTASQLALAPLDRPEMHMVTVSQTLHVETMKSPLITVAKVVDQMLTPVMTEHSVFVVLDQSLILLA